MTATSSITAELLRDLREQRGLSPEEVPTAMVHARIERRAIPSARTIRRVEDTGRKPQARYAHGIATFYGLRVRDLWPAGARSPRRRA